MNLDIDTGEVKVLLTYKDADQRFKIESVWAQNTVDGYKILNSPFFAKNIAYGDIVGVENDNGELYFDRLIRPSGHSTIQMVIFNPDELKDIGDQIIALGGDWEGSHLKGYISIDVPPQVSYAPIKKYLEDGFLNNRWDYKEACLSHEY